jgi:transitional endoplasmic reticulum ATPase
MSMTRDMFERYRQKGIDARRAGQWEAGRRYLLEAARLMVELSKEAQSDALRDGRREMASKLLELAKDCEKAQGENRKAPSLLRGSGGSRGGSAAEKSGGDDDEKDAKDWVVREKPDITFEQVAGLDQVKEEIRLKMLYPFKHPELAAKFGVKPGGGVLMYGPPGTGKTLLARATAGELDATFFLVSPAEIMSKWVGEAEQNIKKLFDTARGEQRSIIFIDEIEALVPARRDEGSSVMQRVIPQILQAMEGFAKHEKGAAPILFMGATNVPWQLDPAVLRPGRFDEKVYIPLPDQPARRKMLDIYLGKRPVDDAVNLDALAQKLDGYSGADIKYICDRAAIIPFMQSVATGQEGEITEAILNDVIEDTKKSVTQEMIGRFEKWAAER